MTQGKIPLLLEPLIDAETALHRHHSVVRDDHHDRIGVDVGDESADPLVELREVLVGRVLELVPGHEPRVHRINVLPESMAQSVGADLMDREEVPAFSSVQRFRDLKAPPRHAEDLLEEISPFLRSKRDVESIGAESGIDLCAELGGKRRIRAFGRSKEVRDVESVDLRRGVPGGTPITRRVGRVQRGA